MSQVVIENPIINSPSDEGITNEIVDGRRISSYFVPVARPKKKDKTARVATARTLWAPAINSHGGFGRWALIEIDDTWNAQNAIRKRISAC